MPYFLALGDSYSIGEGVHMAQCWPMQLAAVLRAQGLPLDDPQIVAATGWSTDELATAIDKAVLRERYALVTLLIGVNDHYRGRHVSEYHEPFTRLLQRAIGLTGQRRQQVIVVSIPDWGVTPFGQIDPRGSVAIGHALDEYNTAAHEITQHHGAYWVDITGISRKPDAELASDGLHPAALQYAHWTAAILPTARLALRSAAAG